MRSLVDVHSSKNNIDTATAIAVIRLTPCQSRCSIRESTNMIIRSPWCPSQAQPVFVDVQTCPRYQGNPSPSSLLPLPFSCHALLGLIPLNILPSSLQPFHDDFSFQGSLGNPSSAVDYLPRFLLLAFSPPASLLNLVCSIVNYLRKGKFVYVTTLPARLLAVTR